MSNTLPAPLPIVDDSNPEAFDLVEALLAQQQSMTAVDRFSSRHDADGTTNQEFAEQDSAADCLNEPAQARYYRDLLPASPPGPGQQFAFNVDLDSCSGCKACVVACHTMNGLEEEESWRRVGTVLIGEGSESRIQHVTTACHHCEDPGCLNGCPVKAYDKDPETGIVRHLDDQCIGCKYCTMMCPYEVPKYSERLGIVRKCDMCHQRLAVGEAPACVQSCPNEAISISIVDTRASVADSDERLASGAPLSSLTLPTTNYVSQYADSIGKSIPQDAKIDDVAESHWPLALMLVGTQVSVGMLLTERISALALWSVGSSMPLAATQVNTLLAFLVGMVGLNVAPLHLGQPLRAWRVFLGLRTSWLSREAVVLGKYVGVLAVALALLWLPKFIDYVPESVASRIPTWAASASLMMAIVFGAAGLFSSAMIYIATKRTQWRHKRTFVRFFGTALVCGSAFALCVLLWSGVPAAMARGVTAITIGLSALKLAWEYQVHLGPPQLLDDQYDIRSRRLIDRELQQTKTARLVCGISSTGLLGCTFLALLVASPVTASVLAVLASLLMLAGECCERLLYFSSVVYDRMPGTLR